ncbi:hypothetical protein GCM10022217_01330 [Chryseobacterium ginsenosidimutans]|uniref:hypothetical protein n=1 Tax=Chryseobacterium ginsenosidimutans TaxID=687846 RepID=UPI0031D2BA51
MDKIVTSIEISKKLNRIGFVENSLFSYYKNNLGEIIVLETDLNSDYEFICYTYTFQELLKYVPGQLEINPDTYIPKDDTFQKIGKKDFEYGQIQFAGLEMFKSDSERKSSVYIMRYAYEGKMIAFTQSNKGLFNNLLRYDENINDCLAKVYMMLSEEKKLNSSLISHHM